MLAFGVSWLDSFRLPANIRKAGEEMRRYCGLAKRSEGPRQMPTVVSTPCPVAMHLLSIQVSCQKLKNDLNAQILRISGASRTKIREHCMILVSDNATSLLIGDAADRGIGDVLDVFIERSSGGFKGWGGPAGFSARPFFTGDID